MEKPFQNILVGTWIALVLITVVTVLWVPFDGELFLDIILFQTDAHLSGLFLALGTFPVILLYSAWLFQMKLSSTDWIMMFFGLFGGSFFVIPALTRMQTMDRRHFTFDRILWTYLIGFSSVVSISILIKGNLFLALSYVFQDAFVTIMFFDYIAFYITSIVVAYRNSHRPAWSFLPLIGYIIAQWSNEK